MTQHVIGLDLSISSTGVWLPNGTGFCLKAPGPKKATDQERLSFYYRELLSMFREYKPCLVAVEDIFVHHRRLNGSLLLIQLHGIVSAAVAQAGMGVDIKKIAPTSLKKFACDDGRASKEDMWAEAVLHGYVGPHQDDVVDAWWLHVWGTEQLELAA